ncbi:MAG: CD225/dispanin family protein [Bacteroidales bacterium]|nr:CD225/dispanin family protein [Bacteroidales bacterium]
MLPVSHSNKMVWAILTTIFCCLVGGIVAIIYSSKSNSLYHSALLTTDDGLRNSLLLQSEEYNKKAGNWILVNIIFGFIAEGGYVILIWAGVVSGLALFA